MRRFFDRDPRRILAAPGRARHWRALAGFVKTFDEPWAALGRYLANRGRYPWRPILRTPMGAVRITLGDRHDLLTVNEVFCRQDYGSEPRRVVVDVGANVGLAALFFLTRAKDCRVWAYEPDPANAARLRETLTGYEGRYQLVEAAVTPEPVASVRFVFAGRYGHLAGPGEDGLEVPALSVAEVVRDVAAQAGAEIDLVKIDTEGTEHLLAAAIPPDAPVREVRYEDNRGRIVTLRRR